MARAVVTYDAGAWDVAGVAPASSPVTVTDAALSTSDITTNNVTTAKHGFTPKLPNDATKYLDGTGAYSVPPGTGGGVVPKLYFNKPAANITRASATLGALSTAWQIGSVVVAAGQNVKLTLDASANNGNTNQDVIFGFVRGSTLLASRIFNINTTAGNNLKGYTFSWVDANPGAGTYTYEVFAAVFGGQTVTVYQTTVTTDTAGGNSIFLAEVYTP